MKEATTSWGASAGANDPRQPSTARPYAPPKLSSQDLPVDYAGFLAVVFGVVGVMLRYKVCSWIAIIFCAQSLANMKNFENDLKQLSMAFMTNLRVGLSLRCEGKVISNQLIPIGDYVPVMKQQAIS